MNNNYQCEPPCPDGSSLSLMGKKLWSKDCLSNFVHVTDTFEVWESRGQARNICRSAHVPAIGGEEENLGNVLWGRLWLAWPVIPTAVKSHLDWERLPLDNHNRRLHHCDKHRERRKKKENLPIIWSEIHPPSWRASRSYKKCQRGRIYWSYIFTIRISSCAG